MKVHELNNYGKSVNEISRTLPEDVYYRIKQISADILEKHLGFFKRFRVKRVMRKERERFLYAGLSDVREKGLTDDPFIVLTVGKAAYFSALAKVLGKEKALEIDKEITAASASPRLPYMAPPAGDLLKFANPFAALKEWLIAFWKANQSGGIFRFETGENSEKVLQIKCLYCAFDKINRTVNEKDSTLAICHFDDIFFSSWDEALGIKYTRNGSLAEGNNCCDFRFEYTRG